MVKIRELFSGLGNFTDYKLRHLQNTKENTKYLL